MSIAARKRCANPAYKLHLQKNGKNGIARLVAGNKNRALPQGVSSKRGLLSRYKREAKMRELDWVLSEAEFETLISDVCYYCGKEPNQRFLVHQQTNGAFVYNGIDRVDNTVGYRMDNCVSCCGTCNWWKGTMTQCGFYNQVARITSYKTQIGTGA